MRVTLRLPSRPASPLLYSVAPWGWEAVDNNEVFELLNRIARKDELAFQTLYRAFSRKVYAYALNQVRDPAKAEEIVADTLYEIWRQPLRFRGDSQFSTWLIGIARNKVLTALLLSIRLFAPALTHSRFA